VLSERADQVDWDGFTSRDWRNWQKGVETEGVASLIWSEFQQGGWPSAVPDGVRSFLRNAYYNSTAHNTLLYRELDRLLTAFSGTGIPVVVLKGAALAVTIYPEIGLRPMGDLDLLVPEAQIDDAVRVVSQLGYDLEGTLQGLNPSLVRRMGTEVNFQGGRRIPVLVELHWSLIGGQESRYQPVMEWFWERIETFKPGNELPGSGEVLCLSPTANLPYLASHLVLKHGGLRERLLWYYDIYQLLDRWGDRLDWDILLDAAVLFNWESALSEALFGIVERFDACVPKRILDRLKPSRVVGEGLIHPWDQVQTRTLQTLEDLADLTWRTRLQVILTLLFPSPKYLRWRYDPQPPWIWPAFYFYRWFDILGDVYATLKQKTRRDTEYVEEA
jgi:hypothetical protein